MRQVNLATKPTNKQGARSGVTQIKSPAAGTQPANKNKPKPQPKIMERKVSASNLKSVERDLNEFVQNMLTVDKPFVLPRAVRTWVAPHKFNYKFPVIPAPTSTKGALIVRPSFDAFLQLAEVGTVPPQPFVIDQPKVGFAWNANDQGAGITMDVPIITGGTAIKSTTQSINGYTHFSDSSNSLKSGFKGYEGVFTISAADVTVRVDNPDNATMLWNVYFASLPTGSGLSVDAIAGGASLGNSVGQLTVLQSALATWRANVLAGRGFAIMFEVTNASTVGRVPLHFSFNLSGPTITVGSAVLWKNYSFWELSPSSGSLLQQQYTLSSRHCTTGLRATFTNCSNSFAKGGQIWAAQLPGNSYSDLPGTIDGLKAFLGERQNNSLTGVDLTDGASWSYTPEKIQDWFFQQKAAEDPYNGNPLDLPYFALAYDLSGVLGTAGYQAVFDLHGAMMVEYITVDTSSFTTLPPSDVVGLLQHLLMELPAHNHVSSNPHHLKEIAKSAMEFVKSPAGRNVLSKIGKLGMSLAPLLLAL